MKQSIGPQTMLYPAPMLLVGTYDENGRANVMTCAWGGICSSDPICVTVSLREATYSYHNIVRAQAYTISVPSASLVKQADFVGLKSGRDTDKFAALGWTATKAEHVDAPYVEECPLVLECKVVRTVELGLHTMFVGQVMDVKADAGIVREKGHLDIPALDAICFDPNNGHYYAAGAPLGKAFSIGEEL